MGAARRNLWKDAMTLNLYYASIGHKPATVNEQQIVQPGDYRIIRFPYHADEFSDEHGMHDRRHPDAYVVQDWATDDRSGLIWPCRDGVACVEADIHWEAGGYAELRDRFTRDPFGTPDDTATDHRPPSTGMQCFTKQHWLKVDRRTPICLKVAHDDTVPRRLLMAQFKLTLFSRW